MKNRGKLKAIIAQALKSVMVICIVVRLRVVIKCRGMYRDTKIYETNTYRKSMVLILELKHQYVNVPTRAWREKYPFLNGRRQDERDKTEPKQEWDTNSDTHHHYCTQSKRNKWEQVQRWREKQNKWVQPRNIITVPSCKSDYQICVSAAQMQGSSPNSTHSHKKQAQHTHLDELTVMQAGSLTHLLPASVFSRTKCLSTLTTYNIIFLAQRSAVLH